MIGISFAGMDYKGCSTVPCAKCGKHLREAWAIYDDDAGVKYYFCFHHYKQWEERRDAALLEVGREFQTALRGEGE